MTITFTQRQYNDLWAESRRNSPQQLQTEHCCEMPKRFGTGYTQDIELYPHLWLTIENCEYQNDVLLKIPDWDHPLQFFVLLSGRVIEGGMQIGEGYMHIAGSGVQRKVTVKFPKSRNVGVDINMSPDLLATFFSDEEGEIPKELRFLAKGNDWQTLLYPKITTDVQGVAQQIINCPYQGITKRMYLQTKVLELIRLQLFPILAEQDKPQRSPRLKAETTARIDYAREILLSHLENPPSLLELAQMVGVSDRTLRRGFKELFGTTVFNYLIEKRMQRAQELLREGHLSVAEVANLVGYSHLGQFAGVFKRKFGITPSQYFLGKKSVS
ncbi:AraC family transcriptional regulator [Mastigocladus laminosus UU774]|nr:AraC family transcriptional regulator [Mastigocladus laminosus UU774]